MISKLEYIDEVKPLFKEYMEHMSQFFEIDDYSSWYERGEKYLQTYSVEKKRHIYILKNLQKIIGFAFINNHLRFNSDGLAIAEFYIQKMHAGKGYGRQLSTYVFEQFSGHWEVAVNINNKSGRVFWNKVVNNYTNNSFVEKRNASYNGVGFLFKTPSYIPDSRCHRY